MSKANQPGLGALLSELAAATSPEMVVESYTPVIEVRCAWCDDEAGVKVTGENISHGICPRHFVSNAIFSGMIGEPDALYYAIIGFLSSPRE